MLKPKVVFAPAELVNALFSPDLFLYSPALSIDQYLVNNSETIKT
jgi:hypothetical protein